MSVYEFAYVSDHSIHHMLYFLSFLVPKSNYHHLILFLESPNKLKILSLILF